MSTSTARQPDKASMWNAFKHARTRICNIISRESPTNYITQKSGVWSTCVFVCVVCVDSVNLLPHVCEIKINNTLLHTHSHRSTVHTHKHIPNTHHTFGIFQSIWVAFRLAAHHATRRRQLDATIIAVCNKSRIAVFVCVCVCRMSVCKSSQQNPRAIQLERPP